MPPRRPGPAWAAKKPRERGEILRKAFELILKDSERLAKLMTLENGKSLTDSRAEVAYAAEFFRWSAEEAVRNIGQMSMAPSSGARILVQHKPAGVAVLVTPWNFPAAMATRKIGPALAAGCTVVLKPASETPLTALALMPILEEAGVPAGVVNVLPSRRSGAVVGEMLKDMRVRVISFTGSTEVGRKLIQAAADNIVKPVMELGGNAPFIVFDDADIDAAVEGAMIAKMRNMGEACTSANRFYVHEKVHDVFIEKFAARMQSLKLGHGLEEGVALGPLVNAETRDKVVHLVEDAVKKGATVVTGGKAVEGKGFYYPATVLTDVPDDAELLREEIFGPVAPIQMFRDEDEVVAQGQRHRIRARRLPLHPRPRRGPPGLGAARVRHGRPQPRHRLRPGRALRRHEAERPRPRRRPRGADGVPRDAIRLGQLVGRRSSRAILTPPLRSFEGGHMRRFEAAESSRRRRVRGPSKRGAGTRLTSSSSPIYCLAGWRFARRFVPESLSNLAGNALRAWLGPCETCRQDNDDTRWPCKWP